MSLRKNRRLYPQKCLDLIYDAFESSKRVFIVLKDINTEKLKDKRIFGYRLAGNVEVFTLNIDEQFSQEHFNALKCCYCPFSGSNKNVFIQCHTKLSLACSREYQYRKKKFKFTNLEYGPFYSLKSVDPSASFLILLDLFDEIKYTRIFSPIPERNILNKKGKTKLQKSIASEGSSVCCKIKTILDNLERGRSAIFHGIFR